MRGIDLLIFDCDGVLVDSEVISVRCLVDALREAGVDIDVETVMERFIGVARPEILAQLQAETGRALPADFLERLLVRIHERFDIELQAIAGVREAILALDCRRCVASGSDPAYIRHALQIANLLDLFDPYLYSATMVTRGKPAPDLFLYAAAQMGVAPGRCLVIEDSEAGVRAGKAAGMTVLAFGGGSHIVQAHQDVKMPAAGCDAMFGAMDELPGLVRARFTLAPAP
jgi:HAD superfamily hydrolase (TIGR01509 family)